jgi:DHA2 family multidrug resistance protein
MLLARRTQAHQSTLVAHINPFDAETAARLSKWAAHFAARGADSFTADRRAIAMVYQEVTQQAQVLAFADDFWLLFVLFCSTIVLLPLLERVRTGPPSSASAREDAPAPVHME